MLKKKKKKLKNELKSSKAPSSLPTKKLSELNNRNSFVFYGRSGTGKTTLSSTFPGPILFLDVKDRGTDSIDETRKDVDVMEVEHWDDFEMTYWWLIKNRGKFKTVVIDTVTQLQQLACMKVLEDKNKSTDKAGEWGTMTQRDWGNVSSMMKQAITNLRDLKGIKIVFIAQDRTFNVDEEVEGESFIPEVGPRLSPATASHLNAEVSIIGNTFIKMKLISKKIKLKSGKTKTKETEEPQYYLRIGPNPIYVTKVRKPKKVILPDTIEDPTYDKIVESIGD